MRVSAVTLRDFRTYDRAVCHLGPALTVIWGPNGAGKTNLLEAVYFGCTGRSCRTANDRELVRFGAGATRVEVTGEADDGQHRLTVAFVPGEPKRMQVDGAGVERLLDSPHRPLVSVFLPDRLELIKGVPALRRAHLDQFVTALWPARAATRRAYAQTLAQRNALLGRVAGGYAPPASLDAWDQQLATQALALMGDRAAAIDAITAPFSEIAEALALDGEPAVAYRRRSRAETVEELAAELLERRSSDLERGFTGHGPHRDDLGFKREGRDLRTYGSQGQQRLALLALLLAERQAIGDRRDDAPLMLLDDVMSELDADRRRALVNLLHASQGQALITATDLDHVPGAERDDSTRIHVVAGQLDTVPARVGA